MQPRYGLMSFPARHVTDVASGQIDPRWSSDSARLTKELMKYHQAIAEGVLNNERFAPIEGGARFRTADLVEVVDCQVFRVRLRCSLQVIRYAVV
jgi:hypothetical protein